MGAGAGRAMRRRKVGEEARRIEMQDKVANATVGPEAA